MINPKLKIGDRVVVLHMDDDLSPVPMGTAGTVMTAFSLFGDDQYNVKWDDGSSLDLISSVDMWDLEDNIKNRKKKPITEVTGSGSGGKYRVPIVLAPQVWEDDNLGPFTVPVSKYLNADLAYDSYDGKMERTKKQISQEEKESIKKVKIAKSSFNQNDDDGNPINGYNPMGAYQSGTPKYIKKQANLPKIATKPVIKNYKQEKDLMVKKRMVENLSNFEANKFIIDNIELFKVFNVKFLQKYLIALRDSGITNMFGAAPYLYMGKERIEHEFKYKNIPNEDDFEEVLSMANQAQAEMINGVIKFLELKNMEPDLTNINRYLQRMASKLVQTYMLLA